MNSERGDRAEMHELVGIISAHAEPHDSSRREELSGVGLIPLNWPYTTIKNQG